MFRERQVISVLGHARGTLPRLAEVIGIAHPVTRIAPVRAVSAGRRGLPPNTQCGGGSIHQGEQRDDDNHNEQANAAGVLPAINSSRGRWRQPSCVSPGLSLTSATSIPRGPEPGTPRAFAAPEHVNSTPRSWRACCYRHGPVAPGPTSRGIFQNTIVCIHGFTSLKVAVSVSVLALKTSLSARSTA